MSVPDALSTGLLLAARRPWLIAIPVCMDLALWLGPRLSIANVVQKVFAVWQALVRATATSSQLASMGELLGTLQAMTEEIGSEVNLATTMIGSWLGAPSALATVQGTRLTFVSDMVLVPVGLNLNLKAVAPPSGVMPMIELEHAIVALLLAVVFWVVGQLLVVVYLRWAASGGFPGKAEDVESWSGWGGFWRLAARLILLSVVLGVILAILRVPLGMAATLMMFSGSAAAGILFALAGGVTLWSLLWFLTTFFFVSETILLDHQPLWRGIVQSMAMVRSSGFGAMGLMLVVNIVMLGFRAIWGVIGQSVGGGVVAIVANGFLATAMLFAIFVYYADMRKRWIARASETTTRGRMDRPS